MEKYEITLNSISRLEDAWVVLVDYEAVFETNNEDEAFDFFMQEMKARRGTGANIRLTKVEEEDEV